MFSFGHGGAYSYEGDVMYLQEVKIVDMSDADMIHTNTEQRHANIEYTARKALAVGVLPVMAAMGLRFATESHLYKISVMLQ
jgi:agmatinase